MKKLFASFFLVSALYCNAQDDLMIDGVPCGIHGSSPEGRPEYAQNVFKNRYNMPKPSDFDASAKLDGFVDGSAVKDKFSPQKAVEVTGYVYDVKVGGTETCNCKTTNKLFKDTHIELTLNDHETGPEHRFIVEVTPRIRQMMADKGIDWTTESLKSSMKGHMVKIQGWLFYDFSHETENFSDDPNDNIGRPNWRATSWEIHPITSIEILDEDMPMVAADGGAEMNEMGTTVNFNTKPTDKTTIKKTNKMEATPLNMLILILLGAILGMVGQGLRVIVGLKKANDEATRAGTDQDALIKTQRIVLSLFIAFAIGTIAGVLAAVGSTDMEITKSTIMAFIAAGYAGTDFIEGFIRKNPIVTGAGNPPNQPVTNVNVNVPPNR